MVKTASTPGTPAWTRGLLRCGQAAGPVFVAAFLLVGVKSLLLNNLQQYFSYNVGLTTGDRVEVIVLTMCVGVLLCGITSFVTLRRYLRV